MNQKHSHQDINHTLRVCEIIILIAAIFILIAAIIIRLSTSPTHQTAAVIDDAPLTPQDYEPPVFTQYYTHAVVTTGLKTYPAETLAQAFRVSDNSDAEPTISIDYDDDITEIFNHPGQYHLTAVATDLSDNTSQIVFTLEVADQPDATGGVNFGQIRVLDGTFITKNGFTTVIKDGVTYIDNILVASKSYGLPASYGTGLTPELESAYETMRQAAASDGITLNIVSGFRSYNTQDQLYHSYVRNSNQAEADRFSARPGYSEHQTGLAIDLNWCDTDFANTPAGIWLSQNAAKYGFILRYPEGKEDITGFIFEPWHFRYVGTDLASQLYQNDQWTSLEEYYGIISAYDNTQE